MKEKWISFLAEKMNGKYPIISVPLREFSPVTALGISYFADPVTGFFWDLPRWTKHGVQAYYWNLKSQYALCLISKTALWLQLTQRMGMSVGILLRKEHCPARCPFFAPLSKPPCFHRASLMANSRFFLVSLRLRLPFPAPLSHGRL